MTAAVLLITANVRPNAKAAKPARRIQTRLAVRMEIMTVQTVAAEPGNAAKSATPKTVPVPAPVKSIATWKLR